MNVTGQTVHPLTAVVLSGENRDPVGHLVRDPIGDREFRFVEIKGESTASQGMAVAGFKLSGASNDFNAVIPFASANLTSRRDFIGIVVATSTAASGMMCYVMTKGKLGTEKGSLYPGALFANVSTTTAAGELMHIAAGSGTSEFKLITVATASAGAMITEYADVVAVALSTDSGGRLIRGVVRSSLLHGGGGFGGIV